MTRETPDRLRALRPLATRDYRLLFAAVGIEVFGTGMWTIVMVFQVLALDDSPRARTTPNTITNRSMARSLSKSPHRNRPYRPPPHPAIPNSTGTGRDTHLTQPGDPCRLSPGCAKGSYAWRGSHNPAPNAAQQVHAER
mgnify:CR=1 FL=1